MSTKAKLYVGSVIGAGALVLGSSLGHWESFDPKRFLVYLSLALLASMPKVRLPGMSGTYSLGSLFILVGILHFSLPETLVVGCAGAVVQTLCNTRKRPAPVQLLFNLGNVSVSIGLCFWVAHGPLVDLLGVSGAAGLAVLVCLLFVVNTGLVSAVLSLLQGKPLSEVSRQWYVWSFPYYLVGAVLVSLLPLSGQAFRPEAWLLLLPPIYLIHFYYGLSLRKQADDRREDPESGGALSPAAKLYISLVIAAGLTLLSWGLFHWEPAHGIRFAGYLAVVVLASTLKVRLPGMTGTIAVNFVVLLAAILALSLSELTVIAATAALVQSLWKTRRRAPAFRVFFNVATLVLSAGLTYGLCRHLLAPALADSLPLLLVAATAFLYLSNTAVVAMAWYLAEGRELRDIWQRCCFWSFPYYLVGAAFAAVMVLTSRSTGWQQSFLVLPLMLLVYFSYRLHVDKAARPV
jgi:hypothetical protein